MAVCAVRYEESMKSLVHSYKIGGRLHLKRDFAEWMLAAAKARFDISAVDAVLPMPVTLFHRIDRGFNPSAYLAKTIAESIDRRYVGNAIARKGFPRRQAGLDEEARRENVKGTFLVLRPELVRSRTILLVDDVATTGSTLSECAFELKRAGAWRVWCLTLARAVR
jgi:ComF family protein